MAADDAITPPSRVGPTVRRQSVEDKDCQQEEYGAQLETHHQPPSARRHVPANEGEQAKHNEIAPEAYHDDAAYYGLVHFSYLL